MWFRNLEKILFFLLGTCTPLRILWCTLHHLHHKIKSKVEVGPSTEWWCTRQSQSSFPFRVNSSFPTKEKTIISRKTTLNLPRLDCCPKHFWCIRLHVRLSTSLAVEWRFFLLSLLRNFPIDTVPEQPNSTVQNYRRDRAARQSTHIRPIFVISRRVTCIMSAGWELSCALVSHQPFECLRRNPRERLASDNCAPHTHVSQFGSLKMAIHWRCS